MRSWWWLHNSVNILKTIELCTLKGWILWFIYCTSIKMLFVWFCFCFCFSFIKDWSYREWKHKCTRWTILERRRRSALLAKLQTSACLLSNPHSIVSEKTVCRSSYPRQVRNVNMHAALIASGTFSTMLDLWKGVPWTFLAEAWWEMSSRQTPFESLWEWSFSIHLSSQVHMAGPRGHRVSVRVTYKKWFFTWGEKKSGILDERPKYLENCRCAQTQFYTQHQGPRAFESLPWTPD